jgi:hypothetical protein
MTCKRLAFAQDREESDELEDMTHPRSRVHDLQDAGGPHRHVMRLDEFAHACGVDSGDAG